MTDSALLAGRAAAEARMIDRCVIRRTTGKTLDPDTGRYVDITVIVYDGPCKVQTTGTLPQTPLAGERQAVVIRPELHLPMSVTVVQVDDVAELTVSPLDPGMVGRFLRIAAQFHKSYATARRFPAEETQA